MKRKKIILSILSAACMTCAVAGISACKKKTENAEIYAVYETYVAYAQANGSSVMSYEEWLNSIKGAAGRGISRIEANEDGDLVVYYTDNSTETVEMPKTYRAFAMDESGNPVPGAWLGLYYLDSKTMLEVHIANAKTGRNGEALFSFMPKKNIAYFIHPADVENHTPKGYATLNINSQTGNYFDSSREASYLYADTNDTVNFNYAVTTRVPYSRIYSATEMISDTEPAYKNTSDDGKRYVSSNYITAQNYTGQNLEGTPNFSIDKSVKVKEGSWRTTESDVKNPSGTKISTGSISQADLEVTLKPGRIKYFLLDPSVNGVNPSGDGVVGNRISWNHTLAAKGKYKITVSGGRLYQFSQSYYALDARGVPYGDLVNYISGTAPANASDEERAKYTGTNSITYNLYSGAENGDNGNATGGVYFYVENDGEEEITVTISVERIGESDDATSENAPINLPPTNAQKFADNTTDTLTLMPMNGSLTLVKGADGYYHINSASGPLLLVNFNKKVARASDTPLALSHTVSKIGTGEYKFSIPQETVHVDDPPLTVVYDYVTFVAEYAKLANSSGVYPVNDDIKQFLEFFGGGSASSTKPDARQYNWLGYCQFYMPAGGLPLVGEGTQQDPFRLNAGENNITNVSGTKYAQYVAPADGFYMIASDTENAVSIANSTFIEGAKDGYYVYATKGSAIGITITADTKIEIAEVPTVKAEEDAENGDKGTGASTPAQINFGVSAIEIDTDHCTDGVWVRYTSPITIEGQRGKFIFTPYVNADVCRGVIVWNNVAFDAKSNEKLIVELGVGESCTFLVKSASLKTGDVFLMTVTRKDSETPTPAPAQLTAATAGNNVTLTGADKVHKFTFTATQDGVYSVTADSAHASIDTTTFRIHAGELIALNISSDDASALNFKVTITRTGDLPTLSFDGTTAYSVSLKEYKETKIDLSSNVSIDLYNNVYILTTQNDLSATTVTVRFYKNGVVQGTVRFLSDGNGNYVATSADSPSVSQIDSITMTADADVTVTLVADVDRR